jgi:hypothetical protein
LIDHRTKGLDLRLRSRKTRRIAALLGLLLGAGLNFLAGQTADEQLALHQRRAQQAEAAQDFDGAIREYRILVRAVPTARSFKAISASRSIFITISPRRLKSFNTPSS